MECIVTFFRLESKKRMKDDMKEYTNYIFDLYGTLVDIRTNEETASFWKKMSYYFKLHGASYEYRELRQEYRKLVEREIKKLCRKEHADEKDVEIWINDVFQALYVQKGVRASKALIADTGLAFRACSLEKLCLYDGARELLCRLRAAGKKIYLLSNAQRLFTEPEMHALGIDTVFDGIMYSSDVGYKKPSDRFYDALIKKYQLTVGESLMIGNEYQADILGALQIGMDSRYLYTEQSGFDPSSLPEQCHRLQNISEVF